jgi:hypothetical protein
MEPEKKESSGSRDVFSYKEELEDDVRLTKQNLLEKSLMVSGIRTKWLGYYFTEKNLSDRMKRGREKILKELNGKNLSYSDLKMKSNDILTKKDPRLQRLDELMRQNRDNIDFIERAMNVLSDMIWQIRTSVEQVKLERM